ncbi:DNA cytosine methyltransferase [Actinotignum sanguinis]|uniref:DNA (cytosine-5-)-methyltransferase n=1 Tax=Schaalia turicensis TaxID=131111 RepID=A0ABZ0R9F3_9ACTO|nr:DNA cytosine methyltransferase [Actinotignum sanguinis]WPJ88401.1 DNA cytosine methyltransferase [Schaalia turicensis]MDE1553535.1 DNA cytosine methyltransferase [Actinotignum sanguinis]MDE1565533.1 DNA cytosine methyltransferase [Actinotignum sanguinis]MDE1577684.1 DNA cytosine methyltransferase [Actinotignum sanguinis]MDE1641630.1 DNA cytosine methyltransferase [Actinotignum sanguinis]
MSQSIRRPIAVDLFSGAGGLSLGLEQAGYDVAASVEYDPIHAAVHEFNFPYGTTICADVRNVSGAMIRSASDIQDQEIHLVAGGPPCQGISLIGKRALDDERNSLLKEFVRLVLELRPRYFVMENVAGLTIGSHRQLLDEVIAIFTSHGDYRIVEPVAVLQAADFGTPQSRKRLFLLGYRQDCPCPSYPSPRYTPRRTDGSLPEESLFPLGPSVSDALADLPDADIFEELLRGDSVASVEYSEPSPYAATLRGVTQDLRNYARLRPAVGNRLTASARTVHTQKSIDRFEATRPGTTEGISRFLRLHPEGICNTLRAGTASDRGAYTAPRPIHPFYPRVITVREAARLHGYPDWFRFHVTKWNGFQEIGNSVPVMLGCAVAAEILKADNVTPTRGEFTPLGDEALLSFTATEAQAYFGLKERVIPQRTRAAG